jgi:hypothetical protein
LKISAHHYYDKRAQKRHFVHQRRNGVFAIVVKVLLEIIMLGKQNGTLLDVHQIDIHGARFWDITYSLESAPQQALHGRIGTESAYSNPAPGDKVALHQVLGVLTKVEKIET